MMPLFSEPEAAALHRSSRMAAPLPTMPARPLAT
jgi:hypothetical protein